MISSLADVFYEFMISISEFFDMITGGNDVIGIIICIVTLFLYVVIRTYPYYHD